MMSSYNHLIKTVQTTNINLFQKRLQRYMSLGFFINGGIHSHVKITKYLPLRIETEYTVFMQKTIKIEDEEYDDLESTKVSMKRPNRRLSEKD
jgi:hypothetical protein